MIRKRWPRTESVNGLGEQQVNHAQTYALRMSEEMDKVDTVEEKLKVAEHWLVPLTTYITQARSNLNYTEPEYNPYLDKRGNEYNEPPTE